MSSISYKNHLSLSFALFLLYQYTFYLLIDELLVGIQLLPFKNFPLVQEGDDICSLIIQWLQDHELSLQPHDILVIAHTIISRAMGYKVLLNTVTPSKQAIELGEKFGKDPRHVQVVLEQGRLLKAERGILIIETKEGYVCANGGVDKSNVGFEDAVLLLPPKPDEIAKNISNCLSHHLGIRVAVIISDTWGRVLRTGVVNIALGSYGVPPLLDYKEKTDLFGYEMRVTVVALADELASAAELLMGEANEGVPVVLIRGLKYEFSEEPAKLLNRDEQYRLFK